MGSGEGAHAALTRALDANRPGSGVDHVLVALASYSVGESLLSHYVDRIPALEHRYLQALLLLNRIEDCEFVFVSSQAPTPEVVAYYESLVPPPTAARMRERVRCVVVPDLGARSLAAKLLDRPDIIDDLRALIGDRPTLIEPWNVTEHEVAVAAALGAPINGSDPSLRPVAFKGAGRRLFRTAGVPTPAGCEDVHDIDAVVAGVHHIREQRPNLRAVVVKHDDSGAGDGNVVVPVVDGDGHPLDEDELRAALAALPAWYLEDLALGGVVEELLDGEGFSSPSAAIDLRPDGSVVVLATHDQILGGEHGQVYEGCIFPADPAYAADLGDHAAAVGAELARTGAIGRAGVDFVSARVDGSWRTHAIEINLRKGGTTHPYAVLRSLVPGRYDVTAGRWVVDADGSSRAYRATDNVVDPAWTGRPPSSVIGAIASAGLQFDADAGTGVVLHMLSCLAIDGRFGATAIGRSRAEADDMFAAMEDAVGP